MTFYQANRISRNLLSPEQALESTEAQYFYPAGEAAIKSIDRPCRDLNRFVTGYYPGSVIDQLLHGLHAICVHTPDCTSYEILWSSDG